MGSSWGKFARFGFVAILLLYAYWIMHREYTLKYLYAGTLNLAVWRALNADDGDLSRLNHRSDASLGIPRYPAKCRAPLSKQPRPISCDPFGGDFGGKSRNCSYWWLGRNCYIFYVPKAYLAVPSLRERIEFALSKPCAALFDPSFEAQRNGEPQRIDYATKSWRAMDCDSKQHLLPREVQLFIILGGGKYETRWIVIK